MNKAFVREPEDDGRAYCPRCRSLGRPVEKGPLDTHISPDARHKMQDAAWYCGFPRCEVAYFNLYGNVVTIDELNSPLYPYDPNAPMCACFGLTYDDVEADVCEGTPIRIRDVVARSKTDEARCHTLAADGCSCLGAVQELYMRLRSQAAEG